MQNVQEAGWVSGSVWTGAENLAPTGSRSPNRPAIPTTLPELIIMIIIIIIIIIIFIISFMQGIYNYIPETNYVPSKYSVAAILLLLFMVLISLLSVLNLLYFYIIIIIIIPVITFMPDVYNYMPEKNHASRVYSVAAVLYVQFVLHVMLFRT